jgi:pectinesterase
MDKHIVPEGWNNWKNPSNEATARYAEYMSMGPGASVSTRAKWISQLSKEALKKYTIENILGSWVPEPTKK